MSSNDLNVSSKANDRVFYCKNCGGVMEFDIDTQKMKCPNCGTVEEIVSAGRVVHEYDFNRANIEQANVDWNGFAHVVKCESCGAEITVPKEVTSITCGYCGSSHVLESKQLAGVKPEGIIPFAIDKNKANEIFINWIKRRYLAPNKLRLMYQQDKLQAIYTPYWTYDSNTFNNFTAQGGEVYYVTVGSGKEQHRERRVRWYPVNGSFSLFFDDVLVFAGSSHGMLVSRIESFDTKLLKPFETMYLSGFQAEKYSVEPEAGFDVAKQKMYDSIVAEITRRVLTRYDEVSSINVNTQYSDVKFKHVLFPVWISGYDYAGKVYTYVINGQNGQITGKYPYSKVKITLLVILAIIIIIIALYLYNQYQNSDYYSSFNLLIIIKGGLLYGSF